MKKIYYHATSYNNLQSIIEDGLRVGIDGVVYLCEKEIDALKFIYARGIRNILVCQVKIDKKQVIETFDHSEAFFQCKAFGSKLPIKTSEIISYKRFDL